MIIALDYDGTYTADPELWLEFVKHASRNGHKVICITMRFPHENTIDPRLTELIDVMCTSRKAKKQFARTQGVVPDIWIDDNPEWLFDDAS